MLTCLYVVTCYLVAKTFIHANSVRKIIILIHVSLQLPKIIYDGENTLFTLQLTAVTFGYRGLWRHIRMVVT